MPLGAFKTALFGAAGGGDEGDFVLLDEVVIPSTAAQIHFTSSGSDDTWDNYQSLLVYASLKNENSSNMQWRFGSYSGGYYWTRADSTGSSIYADNNSGWEARSDGINTTNSSYYSPFRLLLVNHNEYNPASQCWQMHGHYNDAGTGRMNRNHGNWNPSSQKAIDEIYMISGNNNPSNQPFSVGSYAQVFGLKAAA